MGSYKFLVQIKWILDHNEQNWLLKVNYRNFNEFLQNINKIRHLLILI